MVAQNLRALKRDGAKVNKTDDVLAVDPRDLKIQPGFNIRDAIDPDYWNSEAAKARIRKFADAYKKGEFVPKIIVKVIDGVIYVRDGEHRKRGLDLAISEGYDCPQLAVDEFQGDEADQDALILNQGSGLEVDMIHTSVIYGRFIKRGYTPQQIAEKFGVTSASVNQTLAMIDMPFELKRMCGRNLIAPTLAMKMFKKHGTKAVQIAQAELERIQSMFDEEDASQPGSKDTSQQKRAALTEKHVRSGPHITNKVAVQMYSQLIGVTAKLDAVRARPDGSASLELTAVELKGLLELRKLLNEKVKGGESPDTTTRAEEQLSLPVDEQTTAEEDLDLFAATVLKGMEL